jgi:SAM-dependent methyltransferase
MIGDLLDYSASSANDDTHRHLWVKGASLHIPQLNRLIDTHCGSNGDNNGYNFKVVDLQSLYDEKCEALGKVLRENRSDKSTTHNYHVLYSHIIEKLGGKDAPLNILEVGLGTNNPSLVSSMGVGGRPGASLYAFREYLPNSKIYGCDIDKEILFEDERIKTSFVDQLELSTFSEASNKFGNLKYDLVIDDGLHSIGANINTLIFGLENLKPGGWVVIEDIGGPLVHKWKSVDYILKTSGKYETFGIKTRSQSMYVVHSILSN